MRSIVTSRFIFISGCCLLAAPTNSSIGANQPSGQGSLRLIAAEQPNALRPAPAAMQPMVPAVSRSARSTHSQGASTAAPVFPRPGIPSPAFTRPLVEPEVTTQTRQALGFYGGYAARSTLSQRPRRAPIQTSAPQPMHRQVKPFNAVYYEPAVSPYMNLYRDESDSESAPTYYAFVRPQLEQIEANRMQQREIQKLRGQVQGMATPAAGQQYQSTSPRGTHVSARYMDTAQFYGGWRR